MATHSGHARHVHNADEGEQKEENQEILASLPPIAVREMDMELGMLLTG
jgi:hypothetical protein